jgi:nitroimidazol reductase NimA-like FMN-containing flavoprotein (pyridoxamine 5'-phosphate oxidase superfamily)
VVNFGEAEIIQESDAAREALYGLLAKYFPKMNPGADYRPITDAELRQTSVYSVRISSWSGKVNDNDISDQVDDWPALSEEIFNGGFV